MTHLLLKIYRRLPKPLRKGLFHLYSLCSRAMTLGVRIYAENTDGQILLIKHTYLEGWHLPGGGVERGETVQTAAVKELWEETGLEPASPLKLFHIYKNPSHSKFDHVVLFSCKIASSQNEFVPNHEITEIGFFNPNDLPEGTTQSTRNRIVEISTGAADTEIW